MTRLIQNRAHDERSRRVAMYISTALFALLVAGTVHAADATWTGSVDGDWNNAANWAPATPGGADTATFDTSANTFIGVASPTSIGSLVFTPTSDLYSFFISNTFPISGGINNGNLANPNAFYVNSGASLDFTGGAIVGPLYIGNSGTVNLTNTNAQNANFQNLQDNSVINFNSGSNAGTGVIDNQTFSSVNFNGDASAGSISINNSVFGAATSFNGTSTAAGATITNFDQASTTFNDNSTAGNAYIVNAGTFGLGGRTSFTGDSNAGTATFLNSGGVVMFNDRASAANAVISNDPNGFATRSIIFNNSSTAGNATLTTGSNAPPSATINFYDTSNAGTATITANNRGTVTFQDSSDAQQSTLIANNGGTINFRLSSSGNQSRLVANTGGVIGINQLTGAGTSAGSIEGLGRLNLGAKRLTVGSNNLSTQFDGVIQGTGGSLVKTGTGTLTLAGINTYTGATTINAGTLAVDGTLASSLMTVNAGGTLGGTGTVLTTTIASGGTLAPGNSIGTLTVNGPLTFNSGAFYAVEVSPTASDRTIVNGTAALAGTVQASFAPGAYIYRSYSILTATGFGGTTFNALTTNSLPAGFAAILSYTGTEVFLDLAMARPTPDSGYTKNQTAVFNGIANSFDLTGGLPGAFTNLSAHNLTQISGESATGGATSGLLAMDMFLNLMLDPFNRTGPAARPRAVGFAPEQKADAAYAAVTPRDRRDAAPKGWNVWATAFGGSERSGGNGPIGSHSNTARVGGMAAGADYRLGSATLGFSLGGAGANWSLADNLGGGRSDVFLAGAYATHSWDATYASAALAYSWNNLSTSRDPALGGSGNLTGSTHADAFGARIEAGHRLTVGRYGLTPYAALQARSYRADGYSESSSTGNNIYALTYGSQTANTTATELGAWFDQTRTISTSAMLNWRARLAWSHAFNTDRVVAASFQALPGSDFSVEGAGVPRDAALLSAGVEFAHLNGWKLAAKLDGKFAANFQSYTGNASIRYSW